MTSSLRTRANEWALALLITLVAAFLRFYALGQIPPGLYHDEAYNGIDAVQVLQGDMPIFFEANNGREPLFIYLVAASIGLLGRSPLAIRIVAALLGTLTVPAAYLFFRRLYNRNVALLGSAALAITVWPIQLSRIGFRAVALPLFTALALWQLWAGLKSGKTRHFALAGALYALSFYTYLAARFTPLALVIFFAILLIGKRRTFSWKNIAVFGCVALVLLLPLGGYVATHWATFSARAGQVSIFNPDINGGDFWGTLGRDIVKTAAMFNFRGDFIPRHNVPLRAVFDPLLGIAFLGGLVLALVRRRDADLLALVWVAVLLVPTIFAEDAPHFLRSVGILPVALVFPALGLDWLAQQAHRRISSTWIVTGLAVIFAIAAGFTWRDYFVRYANDPTVGYAFEAGATDLAAETNTFLGTGWDGSTLQPNNPQSDRVVYIAPRIWDLWPSLRFLAADTRPIQVLGDGTPPPSTATHVQLVVFPYEPYQSWLSLLPRGSAISVAVGPTERGDLETEPRLVNVTFSARPSDELEPLPIQVNATFASLAQLVGADLKPNGNRLYLTLRWLDLQPMGINYMIFMHVEQAGQPMTTGDGPALQGYYTTDLWRAGDLVVDERAIELPRPFDPSQDKVTVGMYDLATFRRLPVLNADGTPAGDSVVLQPQ